MNNSFKIKKENYVYLVGVLIMHLVYVLPIILANRYYRDDLSRALTGMKGWTGDGRPLTELIIVTLGGGKIAADAAPWYLILAIGILAYALVLYFQNNNLLNNGRFSIVTCISIFLFSINPFLIYAFSYKFDVITMILSLVLLLVLFSVKINSNCVGLTVSVTVGLILFMIYQTSVGMVYGLLMITIFMWMLGKKSTEDIKKDAILSLGVSLSALIYKFVLVGLFINQTDVDWRYGASQLVGVDGYNPVTQIFGNMYDMIYYIVMSLGQSIVKWVAVVITLLVAIIHIYTICEVFCGGRKKKESLSLTVVKALLMLFMPIIILLLNIAPIAFLADAGLKGRLFIPLCDIFMFIGIEIVFISVDKNLIKRVGCVLLAFMMLWSYSFIYIYGNASHSQKEFETYLAWSMMKDVNEIAAEQGICEEEPKTIQLSIVGTTPQSPETYMLTTVYPTLNELVPIYIGNSSWLSGAWLSHFSRMRIVFCEKSDDEIAAVTGNSSNCVKQNLVYNVYIDDDVIYIVYNK